ncbi:MAG: ABC transporter substrate-binding protein [Spirochaetales bacterium]|nr:ABC transporter substrate-binding protein [Spirochaetales bacterium]
MRLQKTIAVLALVSLAVIPVFANGGAEDASGAMTDTLVIAGAGEWVQEIDREIAADFEAQTGIKIEYQVNPVAQYKDVVKTKLNTGNAPDVMLWAAGLELKSLPLEKFVDLSDEDWSARMKDEHKTGATINGKLYGFNSWSADPAGFLYNPVLFERYNLEIPTTYNELKEVCAVFQANGITPIFENAGSSWHLSHFFHVAGPYALAEDPAVYDKLNSNAIKMAEVPAFVRMLNQMKELVDLGYLGDEYLSQETKHSREGMTQERFAMMMIWPSYQVEIEGSYPDQGALDYKMFPNPLGLNPDQKATIRPSSPGGIVHLVPKGANQEAALAFINYRANPDVLNKFYAARQDLASPAFDDVTTNYMPNAQKALIETTEKGLPNFGGFVYFFDEKFYTDAIRGLLIDETTTEEVLGQIDEYRLRLGQALGLEGF